jgi:hypothetical protein
MTALLLDYQWSVLDALDVTAEPFRVLHQFEKLRAVERLELAPFIESEQLSDLWTRGHQRHAGQNRVAPVARLLAHCVRKSASTVRASPLDSPTDVCDTWRRGLRDSMSDLTDWRDPQVIVCERRLAEWTRDAQPLAALRARGEVSIECEDRPADGPHNRVLACLESYDQHEFAKSDRDPWDLVRIHPFQIGGHPHPCRLPKPELLLQVEPRDLGDKLRVVRANGCRAQGRYCFVPTVAWDAMQVAKSDWRHGRAFSRGVMNGRTGPIDYEGNVWAWDNIERHWDVQQVSGDPAYVRVSHTGEQLG